MLSVEIFYYIGELIVPMYGYLGELFWGSILLLHHAKGGLFDFFGLFIALCVSVSRWRGDIGEA